MLKDASSFGRMKGSAFLACLRFFCLLSLDRSNSQLIKFGVILYAYTG